MKIGFGQLDLKLTCSWANECWLYLNQTGLTLKWYGYVTCDKIRGYCEILNNHACTIINLNTILKKVINNIREK